MRHSEVREVMGLDVLDPDGPIPQWITPDLSRWRLVGGDQLQRWHADAQPAAAWIAYHPGIRWVMIQAVAYSLGYSRRAMLRSATPGPVTSPFACPPPAAGGGQKDIRVLAEGTDWWGVGAPGEAVKYLAVDMIRRFPARPRKGGPTECRETVDACHDYAIVTASHILAYLVASMRLQGLLKEARDLADETIGNGPQIIPFPGTEGGDDEPA